MEMKTLLQNMLPQSLDDIIRLHRDEARLYLSTPEQIKDLSRAIVGMDLDGAKDTLEGWYLITLDAGAVGKKIMLLGDGLRNRAPWITSAVKAVDLGAGFAVTHNSTYQLGTPGEGEPSQHLLIQVCAYFTPSIQQHFGIPAFFF